MWVVLSVSVVVAGILFWWYWLRVPDVVGLSENQARIRLAQVGREVGEVHTTPAIDQEAGIVTGQSPQLIAFRLWRPEVDLWVTVGQLGARVQAEEEPGPLAEGEPGTELVVPADTFVMPASDGKPRVPNVHGHTLADAIDRIRQAGYEVETVQQFSTTAVPLGRVWFQDPAPQTIYEQGGVVTLRVSAKHPVYGTPKN
jgi:serine/threonine-protein kinase